MFFQCRYPMVDVHAADSYTSFGASVTQKTIVKIGYYKLNFLGKK